MNHHLIIFFFFLFSFIASSSSSNALRVAIIGDYGRAQYPEGKDPAPYGGTTGEKFVADKINASGPFDFIATVGDNCYNKGEWDKMDENIGQFYRSWIYPYVGNYSVDPSQSKALRDKKNYFWPVLGNHDLKSVTQQNINDAAYLTYFRDALPQSPAKGRYYEFVRENVHFIMMNSNAMEPDGITLDSTQGQWVKRTLANSNATFKLVLMHHMCYSNDANDGSTIELRYPYKLWGATAVLSGHCHCAQKFFIDGMTFIVNGLGGTVDIYPAKPRDQWFNGTLLWYNATWGFQILEANECSLNLTSVSIDDKFLDVTTFYADNIPKCASWNPSNMNNNNNKEDENSLGTGIAIGVGSAVGCFLIGYVIMTLISKNSNVKRNANNNDSYENIRE